MKKPFQTYSSAGLLAGALAALCFGAAAPLNAVFPTAHHPVWAAVISFFGPACCLMLPGLLLRPSFVRLFRFAVGTFFGSLIIACRPAICVNYNGVPPPPWPDFATFGRYYLVPLCLVGFLATFYLSGQRGHWLAKTLSPPFACVFLALLGTVFLKLFPPRLMVMEKWEYLTLVVGGPLFGLSVWGWLDIKTKERNAEQGDGGDP